MTREEKQTYLAALHAARQRLLTGEMETQISYDGRSTTFKTTDLASLNGEIAKVEAELGLRRRRRAIGVRF